MEMERLQKLIRKSKNPVVLDFSLLEGDIPPQILEQEPSFASAWERYGKELLEGMQDSICAVRFSMNMAAAYGSDGMVALAELLRYAKSLGYFVMLDGPASHSAQDCERSAMALFSADCNLSFDALIVSSYIGSDGIRPYTALAAETGKALFVLVRTPNRSAQDLQDLRTGSRLVYMAMADLVNRYSGEQGKSGYTGVGVVGAANTANVLETLRSKYNNMFILVDGYEAPGANAKVCASAFDRFGHGAAVCASTDITAAWQCDPWTSGDYLQAAKEAADRIKKNILRYITIL